MKITNGINLLPWRKIQYQQKLRQFMWKFIIAMIIALLLNLTLVKLTQQQQLQLSQQQQILANHNQQFESLIQQINKLKSQQRKLTITAQIPSDLVQQLLNFLQHFPLEHGELSQFSLTAEQVQLQGNVKHQTEFEQINQFLATQTLFSQVKLQQFKLEKQDLLFEFELPLKDQK